MPEVLASYELHQMLGIGGQAIVHLGRKRGVLGFTPVVAIKRLKRELASDAEALRELAVEARMSACVSHANVVQTLDVIEEEGELCLVLELVIGTSLARLMRGASLRGENIPVPIACTMMRDLLLGLAAAHEATSGGKPLGLVHRDVSPQNVLVSRDGIAKLADFGIAKAGTRTHVTAPDVMKGKLAYMAPEYIAGKEIDLRVDLFAAGVVLWEMLTGRPAFGRGDDAEVLRKVRRADLAPASTFANVPAAVDDVIRRSVTRTPETRFASAREMAAALEEACACATREGVAAYVQSVAEDEIRSLTDAVGTIERDATRVDLAPSLVVGEALSAQTISGHAATSPRRPTPSALGFWPLIALAVAIGIGAAVLLPRSPSEPSASTHRVGNGAASGTFGQAEPGEIVPVPSLEPATTARPRSGVRRPSGPANHRASKDTSKDTCNPPWTIDERGLKRYRDECL